MTRAIFRAMLLRLLHDRGALAMGFVIPVVFFIIFAEIFTSAADGELRVRVALVDETGSDASRRVVSALDDNPSIRLLDESADVEAARELVRRGTADVGLVIRGEAGALEEPSPATAPLLLLVDPSRGVTAEVLRGQLQRAYLDALPEVPVRAMLDTLERDLGVLTSIQREAIETGLGAQRDDLPRGWEFGALLQAEAISGQSAARNHVAYYAGAIAFMFLMLAAAQASVSLIEEHESGVLERIAVGPGGTAVVVNGKFLYLCAQGFVQAGLIFAAAWLLYGVDLPGNLAGWLIVTVSCALAAAGLGLLLVAMCGSRAQAQLLPVILIVIVSAVGGSMVPRFFMPPWLQELGWLTPNTWALEAYSAIFWHASPPAAVLLPCIMLALTGLAALGGAHLLTRRLVRD